MSYYRSLSTGRTVSPRATLPALWQGITNGFIVGGSHSESQRVIAFLTGEGEAILLHSETGKPYTHVIAHDAGGFGISFSRRGVLATWGQDGTVNLWHPPYTTPAHRLSFPKRWVEHLKWNPSGSHFVASSGRVVRLYTETGILIQEFTQHESTIAALEWDRKGETYVTACYGAVRFFSLHDAQPTDTLLWKTSFISLGLSPNRRFLAAGTQERDIHIWPLPYSPHSDLHMSGYPNKVSALSYDALSTTLATNCDTDILIWDITGSGPEGKTPEALRFHSHPVKHLSFQKKGSRLVSGDEKGIIALWNPKKSYDPIGYALLPSAITALHWSDSETLFFAGCESGHYGVWKV